MLAQDYGRGYDVWFCSERPTNEMAAWCAGKGVKVSTRHGEPDYQRDSWPRRTRCKEGNLAYFYDRVGYRDYDVVVQLDCDHTPGLTARVRPPSRRWRSRSSSGFAASPRCC